MSGMTEAKELRAKRANLAEQSRALIEAGRENESGTMSAEQSEQFDRIHQDMESLRRQYEAIERQVEIDHDLEESRGRRAGGQMAEEQGSASTEQAEDRREAHARAFRSYLRHGIQDMPAEDRRVLAEHRAQSVGVAAGGGYTVPEGFSNQLEDALLDFGGVREAANVFATDSGNDLPWPTVNDTAQKGALLAENTQVAEQDVTFDVVTYKAYKYSSKMIRVSEELLQDSAFDMDAFLPRKLGERIGRITNEHFTTGDGTAKPLGIVNEATVGKVSTAAAATYVVTYADLVDLEHSVDPAYRRMGARWMFHDSTLRDLKKIVDADGRPLWSPGVAVREPDQLMGYGYTINQDMPVQGADAKCILFGALTKYQVRDVRGISVLRLTERFADFHQVAFLAFSRHDGRAIDAGTNPIKYFQNSAAV